MFAANRAAWLPSPVATMAIAMTLLLLSGCGESPTEPARLAPVEPARLIGGCEAQVIADPDVPCDVGGGASSGTTFIGELTPISVRFDVSSSSGDANGSGCPTLTRGTTVATIRSPKTGRVYDFTSSGTWLIDIVRSIIYLPSRQAIYRWPPGFWPAFDQQTGAYALIKIGSARGYCQPGKVTFFTFYDVVMEGDEPRPKVSPTSGGGGGGDASIEEGSCHTEYVYIELDDGNGWYVWLEGNATVCE